MATQDDLTNILIATRAVASKSLKLVPVSPDVPIKLSAGTVDAGGTLVGSFYFYGGEFYLDASADAGGCRIGGPEVSVANRIGIPILPGQYYPVAWLGKAHHTTGLYVAFAAAGVNDIVSGNIYLDAGQAG